jgi:hypothetical protein
MRLQYALYNATVVARGQSADITSFRPFAHSIHKARRDLTKRRF